MKSPWEDRRKSKRLRKKWLTRNDVVSPGWNVIGGGEPRLLPRKKAVVRRIQNFDPGIGNNAVRVIVATEKVTQPCMPVKMRSAKADERMSVPTKFPA